MRKIIYFDEASALDLIDIKNKGRSEEILQSMVEKASKFGGEGAFGTGWLDNLTTGITGSLKAGLSRNKRNIIFTNITNTILTSFLELLYNPKPKKGDKEIQLETIKVNDLSILAESATYLKSITPFIKILKEDFGKNTLQSDIENFNFYKMDEILESAKGYYELVAVDGDSKKSIVRFNLDGFRNNYRLQDLQLMSLTLYGVKVGEATEASLNFMYEIQPKKDVNSESLGFDAFENEKNEKPSSEKDNLDIIDIILAGVE
ncbi:DUF6414 family protein [Bacillus cereus group sp. MYBK120-1]|uniref:DUF6414 family protein n=1 Tax=Bacillus cereus group sp. MYBK120-1 TaxID=3450691 RepID=UPI003F794E92